MGSATREALASSKQALEALGPVSLATAVELLQVGRVVGDSAQLRALLADPSAVSSEKIAVVDRVFGAAVGADALGLLTKVVELRWSSHDDLLAGIEELGFRAAALSAGGVDIDSELFAFSRAVSSDAELELALGSKLGQTEQKVALVERLIGQKGSPQTVAIISHLVQQPRGRRIGELLRAAASIVADQLGFTVATVTSAVSLSDAQLDRLKNSLAANYGRSLKVNQVTDPSVIGGLRVQVADDVFDGSIAARLAELKLQLAG